MNINKPIFELTDIELKSIAYDMTREIKRFKKNLDLIEMEFERRRNSVVATMTHDQLNQSIQGDENKTI